ncbi:pseudouridylate synthase [Cladophialophora psammophila CBS 110553]|uniref:Pseudouridylate synthase n=1 Tax=Cladophialophora psammophila CBS 110553 TaxID=1182543 RepID=W9X3E7_9EURO|nr:pseudouridylate synthase [Cladophialophora psammophila CBS 110553]EXJ74728.1 pseudouridylate synthase [Cladophialophora psammophila CBS 110553]
MAMVATETKAPRFFDDRKPLTNPPSVAITPCDPWPRPYYLENGLRRVAPYHFTYNTYCKQRWRGREILDIFAAEFRDRTREYYKQAIETGQISINGKPCKDVHTIVQNGDVISHTLHRHEPPVTAQPIRVINETEEMIVIDKPAGVPVHPAGRYNYNSVVEIMKAERHFSFKPLPCNRLDRLTSGVMFIGKTSKEAEAISEKLRSRTVRKEYVARVKGRFPDGDGWDKDPMRGGIVKCEESILQISPIVGLNRARASGRSAKTLFRRVAYYPDTPQPSTNSEATSNSQELSTDGQPMGQPAPAISGTENEGYSIVHCLPLTGRTHQIRVHLQFLGHPITNDPIYSNRAVFGPSLAKHDSSGERDEEIIAKLKLMGKSEVSDSVSYEQERLAKLVDQTQQMTVSGAAKLSDAARSLTSAGEDPYFKPLPAGTLHAGSLTGSDEDAMHNDPQYGAFVKAHDEMVADYNKRKGEKMTGEKCPVCDTPLYSDPGPHELGIYLHALSYADVAAGSWSYRSPAPQWALPPNGVDGPREIGPWEYRGDEILDIGDEREDEKVKNRSGLMKNKGEQAL